MYNSRTHHSNMDTLDRIQRDDLVQMSIVLANFAYNTAMHSTLLPRKVMLGRRRASDAAVRRKLQICKRMTVEVGMIRRAWLIAF